MKEAIRALLNNSTRSSGHVVLFASPWVTVLTVGPLTWPQTHIEGQAVDCQQLTVFLEGFFWGGEADNTLSFGCFTIFSSFSFLFFPFLFQPYKSFAYILWLIIMILFLWILCAYEYTCLSLDVLLVLFLLLFFPVWLFIWFLFVFIFIIIINYFKDYLYPNERGAMNLGWWAKWRRSERSWGIKIRKPYSEYIV